jgi:transglutaminase-like putative cysteine protease
MNAVRLVLAAGLAALAGVSFAPVFGGIGAALLLAVLTPPAVALAWALWPLLRPGDRPHVPLGIAVLGVLAVAVAVAVTTSPGADVASGPYRLLTGALPADPSGPQLAAVSALTGYTALIACYLALTRRAPLAPVLPSLVCLLAGLGLGAATGPLPVWYPSAFVALAGLQLLLNRVPEGTRGARLGSLTTAVVVLAVGTVAPVALAGVLPGADNRKPAELRSLVDSPVLPKADTNPFAKYLALRDGRLVLGLTGTASEPFARLRAVTLTEFDGRTWSPRADYRRAGHQLPPGTPAGGHRVTVDVSATNLDTLGWLPTAGRASDVSVADLGVDESTGDLVVPADADTPTAYRVTGSEPEVDGSEIARDTPARATTRQNVDLPPDILGFIAGATAGATDDTGRLLALYHALTKSPFGYDGSEEAAGGHGLFRISALLREKRGTSEQYASAFAAMCRHLGWDARVVLGFRPQWDGNSMTVTGKDIHAWTEVRFTELGWVPVDPTPPHASAGREPEEPQHQQPPDNPFESMPDTGQRAVPEPGGPDGSSPRPVQPSSAGQPVWLTITISVCGLVAVLAAAVPITKTVRRARRRRNGTPRTRTVAAWHEALDALRETGFRFPSSATTREIVAGGVSCPPGMHSLSRRVDLAAFAPEPTTESDARAAWSDSDAVRKAVRRRLGFPARVRAFFDPRPVLTRNT